MFWNTGFFDRNPRFSIEIVGFWIQILRGCSYGSELARLGGLAHLGEISPFLRNSFKKRVHMRSEPARLGGISLDFAGIPPRWDKNLSYEHVQVGQHGKVG